MKKLLIFIALLGVGVAAAMFYSLQLSPTARVCNAIELRCGPELLPASECRESLGDASAHDLEVLQHCAEPSESCAEVLACLSGSVMRDAARGFLRGLSGPR